MLRRVVNTAICGLALVLAFSPALACRQALILGLDVSRSVDSVEYTLQRQGLAAALTDRQVMALIVGPPGAQVELLIFEWSGHTHQRLIVGWTTIDAPETLRAIAATLANTPRSAANRPTAIGAAMLYAGARFRERPGCAKQTLDLSGDGKSNDGTDPHLVKPRMARAGVVVNGLVIGNQGDEQFTGPSNTTLLRNYYLAQVITGPGAFIETAQGYRDYAEAIKRKLLRETIPAVAQVTAPNARRPL